MNHPGVVLRDGPAGRRAGLADGPDVAEIVAAMHAVRADDGDLVDDALVGEVADVTGLTIRQVLIALRYYAAFPDEIDDMIAANDAFAQREERLALSWCQVPSSGLRKGALDC